jgi:hypothetical protein
MAFEETNTGRMFLIEACVWGMGIVDLFLSCQSLDENVGARTK